MSANNGPTALVSGVSSGIGECIAEDLAGRGYNLILVAWGVNLTKTVKQRDNPMPNSRIIGLID